MARWFVDHMLISMEIGAQRWGVCEMRWVGELDAKKEKDLKEYCERIKVVAAAELAKRQAGSGAQRLNYNCSWEVLPGGWGFDRRLIYTSSCIYKIYTKSTTRSPSAVLLSI